MNIKQVFETLDDYIGYYEKAKDAKPAVIRLNKEQHRLLKKWADDRKTMHQETVVLGPDENVKLYRGIEVRVQ